MTNQQNDSAQQQQPVIGLGCVLNFCLFWSLFCAGIQIAHKHSRNGWLGIAWGLLTWFAIICGYAAWIVFYDWLTRKQPLDPKDDTWWITPLIWVLFLPSSWLSIILLRHLLAGAKVAT